MRIIPLGIAIMMFIVLAGCTQKETAPAVSSNSIEPHVSMGVSAEPTATSTAKQLADLANQSYAIPNDQLTEEDYDSVVAFGKAFVNLYTGAVAEQQKVSFENYISNTNLLAFVNKMLELEQKQELRGGFGFNFGFDNAFKEAKFKILDDTLSSLSLHFAYQGSGMNCKMLVQAKNKSLSIVDVYFGNKDGVDTLATGHPAVRKLDNPKRWDDVDWVAGVWDKLDNYESAKE